MTIKKQKTIDAVKATKDIWEKTTFGGLIRSLRIADEISQIDLAKKLKVSPQFLSDVEHNRKEIGIGFAKKASKELGYPIEIFLELLIRDQLRSQKLHFEVKIMKAS